MDTPKFFVCVQVMSNDRVIMCNLETAIQTNPNTCLMVVSGGMASPRNRTGLSPEVLSAFAKLRCAVIQPMTRKSCQTCLQVCQPVVHLSKNVGLAISLKMCLFSSDIHGAGINASNEWSTPTNSCGREASHEFTFINICILFASLSLSL